MSAAVDELLDDRRDVLGEQLDDSVVSVTDTPTPMNRTGFIGSCDHTNRARPSVTHISARSPATSRREQKYAEKTIGHR